MGKDKIFIISQSDEKTAGSRTRVFQYLPFFERAGLRYDLYVWFAGGFAYKMSVLFRALFHRTLFIQKITMKPPVLKVFKLLRKKIIFDFDDAIFIFPNNACKNIDHLIAQIEASRLVVIENEYNEKYIKENTTQGNVLKVLGPIDTQRYSPRSGSGGGAVTVGWIGGPSTTTYLLSEKESFARIKGKYGDKVRFVTIGADEEETKGTVFEGGNSPWTLESEVAELAKFDIGIMPLPDDPWTRGKGGYKLLQYMAMGIPCVCSPVGVNEKLIRDGESGFLAGTSEQWVEKISLLVENENDRKKMGAAGRDDAVRNYSFDHYAPILVEAIRDVIRK